MKKKRALVVLEFEDEHPLDSGSTLPIGTRGLKAYLDEILEVPQYPEAEPGEGYYITNVDVVEVIEAND